MTPDGKYPGLVHFERLKLIGIKLSTELVNSSEMTRLIWTNSKSVKTL